MVWTGTKEAEHHLEVSTVHLQVNASWKASVTITHEGTLVFAPRIGVDHSGHTVVTWSVETSVGVVVIKGSTHDERSSLQVTKSGAGAGMVTSLPARIDCGSTCSGEFFEGVTVTLTATPASGSRFAGWSGACSGIGACAVEIGESQSVNAEFVPTSSGGETGGDGEPGAGGITTTTDAGASKAAAGAATSRPGPEGSDLHPDHGRQGQRLRPQGEARPGRPRRPRQGLGPAAVNGQVSAMLGFGNGSSIRLADLGSASFHTAGSRNLRFALPKGLRSALPPGSGAHLILSIAAKPDAEQGCGHPSTVKRATRGEGGEGPLGRSGRGQLSLRSGAAQRPLEPKPPSPRAESESSVTSTGAAIATGVTTSWAIRAPASIRTVSAGSVFSSSTRTSPR